jgi:hypothetical protein
MPELSTWYYIGDPDWVLGMMRRAGFLRPRRPPDWPTAFG